jgi:hypothetical protein
MKQKSFFITFALVLTVMLTILSGCKYNTKNLENPKWESNALTPLVSTRLTMQNVVGDTTLKVEGDNSLTYVHKQTLLNVPLKDYLAIPDTELVTYARLDSLKLSSQTITYAYTLGRFARDLIATGIPSNIFLGSALLASHGSTIPNIPALTYTSGSGSPWQEFNATSLFKSATLRSGFLEVKMENRFPIELQNLSFKIRNKTDKATIANIVVPVPLEADTGTYTHTENLAGKTVEGTMEGQVISMNVPSTNNVPIDTNKAIIITLRAYDLQAEKATAVFPTQYLKNDKSYIVYNMGGSNVTKIKVKTGKIRIKVESALQDTMYVLFSVPKAIKDGDSLIARTKVPPAPPGGVRVDSTIASIAGYEIDYTYNQFGGPGVTVNTFEQIFQVRIDSTGIERTIDISDSVKVTYGLYDIVPEYAEGWFINKDINIEPGSVDFAFFEKIQAGTFDFQSINMDLTVENSIGVNANMYVGGKIKGLNTRTGNAITLTSPVIDNVVTIMGPTLAQKGQTITNTYSLNKSNSNIQAFLNNLPNKITYQGIAKMNEGVPSTSYINHAYDYSRAKADLNINIPLNGVADHLTLLDTSNISFAGSGGVEISEGTLKLMIDNKFPFSASIQAYFIDNSNRIVDSLFVNGPSTAQAGKDNGAGLITEPNRTILPAYVSKDKMSRIRNSKKVVFKIVLNTVNGTKIYSDYGIDLKIIGDFKYTSSTQ